MKRRLLYVISVLLFISLGAQSLSADPSSSDYDEIEFPQWVRDLRRTEIITFGSLPFVTLWTTVGYSLYEYGEFRNPLDKSTGSFTEADQWNIIKISAATCIALGLTDLTINLISRARKSGRLRKERGMQAFTITPAGQTERGRPPSLEDESDEQAEERLRREREAEDRRRGFSFIEGVESALF